MVPDNVRTTPFSSNFVRSWPFLPSSRVRRAAYFAVWGASSASKRARAADSKLWSRMRDRTLSCCRFADLSPGADHWNRSAGPLRSPCLSPPLLLLPALWQRMMPDLWAIVPAATVARAILVGKHSLLKRSKPSVLTQASRTSGLRSWPLASAMAARRSAMSAAAWRPLMSPARRLAAPSPRASSLSTPPSATV
eukprot:scaffold3142_cov416-Prasinococcus_capsulatus_cf.AAC.10